MSDHQNRHSISRQVVLEPFNHVNVEVVGGLVKDEEIGLVDKDFCQCHSFDLSARQLLDRLVDVGDFKHRENLFEAVLIVPSLAVVHFLNGCGHGIGVAVVQGVLVVSHSYCQWLVAFNASVDDAFRRLK